MMSCLELAVHLIVGLSFPGIRDASGFDCEARMKMAFPKLFSMQIQMKLIKN